ncbi:hypothetical protein QFW77_14090 [Luteimonas sp. RD2P54]|uniref:PAP2 superfamily protein n=1 Tax=Luteimonas endophytica TaxID=3042023 RepID=A0ABT6JD44_9GAMM|nr:hypothetical protein [Luteimonas endophytica]MDH5824108.1 hypothetical protein [Luteimonas endophytica]
MKHALARPVSILGHPLLMLPLALLLPAVASGMPGAATTAAGFAAAAALVMGWSWRRVRTGRWAHVDASDTAERRSLNLFLLPVLAVAALLALHAAPNVALYLALSASIVAAAILSSRWCKLSLHAAFAVFCGAMLLRWSAWAGAAVLAFAIAVLWSRLALARHLPRDLVAGAAAGAAAAVLSWPLAPDWPAP